MMKQAGTAEMRERRSWPDLGAPSSPPRAPRTARWRGSADRESFPARSSVLPRSPTDLESCPARRASRHEARGERALHSSSAARTQAQQARPEEPGVLARECQPDSRQHKDSARPASRPRIAGRSRQFDEAGRYQDRRGSGWIARPSSCASHPMTPRRRSVDAARHCPKQTPRLSSRDMSLSRAIVTRRSRFGNPPVRNRSSP